jgi:translocation and assembly module TamB
VLSVREQANRAAAGGIAPDSAQGSVVTVGKRLSSRLFLTYEQSLRGVWNILKLQYEITDRLSLSVQAGSDSATDLLWFFPFD